MKIIGYRPTPHGEGNTIAMLDAEVSPGVRLFGMRLLRMPDGSHRVYGVQAAFDREVVATIVKAAFLTEAIALTASQAKPDSTDAAADDRYALTFGICDRLTDNHHCFADVVLCPAGDDGEPDWDKASPASVEKLPGDEWPEDEPSQRAACVLVSDVAGCDPDATFLIRLHDDDGNSDIIQIHGPETDRPVAEQIIARDIGREIAAKPKSAFAQLLKKVEAMGARSRT